MWVFDVGVYIVYNNDEHKHRLAKGSETMNAISDGVSSKLMLSVDLKSA